MSKLLICPGCGETISEDILKRRHHPAIEGHTFHNRACVLAFNKRTGKFKEMSVKGNVVQTQLGTRQRPERVAKIAQNNRVRWKKHAEREEE